MVRLAIWTSQYPEPYETFIKSETEHLISTWPGSEVHVLKGPGSLPTDVPRIHRHIWWSPAALVHFLLCWLRQPKAMAGILRDLWGGFVGCPRRWELFKSLAVWPLACRARIGSSLQLAHWTNVPSTIAWVIRRLGGPPYVMVVHGENLSSTWPLLKIKLDEAAEVLSCTHFNAHRLAAAGLRKPVVCPHGVDIPPASLPLLGGGQGGGLKGLSVGRLVPTKGFHILLEALAKLEGEWKWTLVGDGPEKDVLESQATRLGIANRLTFTGRLPHSEVLALYPQHHVFALPFIRDASGDSDGLPNALLEAMAAGLAVIASNDAAAPEAVEDGVSGILVTPGSIESLFHALKSVMQDAGLWSRLGTEARKKVQKIYGRDMCIQKLMASLGGAFLR